MTSGDKREAASPGPRFHGRRHGRKLRCHRKSLFETLLPVVRVPTPLTARSLDPRRLFAPTMRRVWLEIGFGSGELLAGLARAAPDVGFIGCEPYVNGVAALLATIERERLTNVRIFDDDARRLLPALAPASLGAVIAWFPDPWPKARHENRRLFTDDVGRLVADVLDDAATLWLASDHEPFVAWTRRQMRIVPEMEPMEPTAAAPDMRPPAWIPSRYEEKARACGLCCHYLAFRRRPRSVVDDGEGLFRRTV